jgi:hypothetical protein
MKDSIDQSQESIAMQSKTCSEEKCPTCFENRGCIYEPYFPAVMQDIEKFLAASQKIQPNPALAER